MAEYLVPGWLRAFAGEQADVSVSLEMGNTSHVDAMVTHGEVELGFIEGPRPPGTLRARAICDDELVVVVARTHPWARRRRPLSAQELGRTPLILREPGSGTRDILTEALGSHGLDVRPLMELGSTTAIKTAAIAGSGPAVLSRLAVDAELRTGQLVVIDCAGLDLARKIRAVWLAARPLSPPAVRLVALASEPYADLSRTK